VSGFQPRRRLSGGAVVTRRDSCVGADKRLYKIVRAFARCFAASFPNARKTDGDAPNGSKLIRTVRPVPELPERCGLT